MRLKILAVLGALGLSTPAVAQDLAGGWEGELATSQAWPVFIRIDVDPQTRAATLTVLGSTIPLGQAPGDTLAAAVGEGADQLKVDAHVEGGQLVGAVDQAGERTPFSLSPIAPMPAGLGRVAGWGYDLDALRDRVLKFDHSFSPAERAAAVAAIARLRTELPRLSDDAVRVRMARIMALAGNAHTRLYLLRNRSELGRLPVRLWWFGDQLRVLRAAPAHAGLVGCRVTQIDGLALGAAHRRLASLYAGSPTWKRYMTQYTLTSPSLLRGSGIAGEPERVRLALADCDATGSVTLAALPPFKASGAVESWWDLSAASPFVEEGWASVHPDPEAQPLYLRHTDKAYSFTPAAGGQPFYVQLTRSGNDADETLADFAGRVAQSLAAAPPRAIVFDLRFDTGGDFNLATPLVEAIAAVPASTRIYVVTGRSTFSAGIVTAAQLKTRRPDAIVVGEPVGDALDFYSEGGNVILPYSHLAAHFANGAHSLSPAKCPTGEYCNDLSVATLAPDLPAAPTWTSYRAGIDPAMEAIARDLARRP